MSEKSPFDFIATPDYVLQGNAAYDRNSNFNSYFAQETWWIICSTVRSQNYVAGPYAPTSGDVVYATGIADAAAAASWSAISGSSFTAWRTYWSSIGAKVYDVSFYYTLGLPDLPGGFTSLLAKTYEEQTADYGSYLETGGGGSSNTFDNDGTALYSGVASPPKFVSPGSGIIGQLIGPSGLNSGESGSNIERLSKGGGAFSACPFSFIFPATYSSTDIDQSVAQCSYWFYSEDAGNYTKAGHTTNILRNRVYASRSRFRVTKGVTYWWAEAEIIIDPTYLYFTFQNITLLGQSVSASEQWVDKGLPQASGVTNTSVPSGGIGRMMIVIHSETPDDWTTRTGFTFTNYP